ncbi:MAG TPA: putative toxin-antitoxin system toxin component, PIN family [Candidatus Sulfotelmatobacter sp.]|nr:putative toxin-antitoxin system toxin component, PIN family [Candidatus Sulfotelmatobacter sp.]
MIAPAALAWLKQLLAMALLIAPTERIAACRDPTDDRFLELAAGGNADFIVTGDSDLLALDPFRGIPIVAPAAFIGHAMR